MKINGIFITAVFLCTQFTFAQQINMSEQAKKGMTSCLISEKHLIPVNKSELIDKTGKFQKWVDISVNLDKSSKRESTRFNRTTYKVANSSSQMRLLSERFDPLGTIVANAPLIKRTPAPAMYREGPMYFKFKLLTENKASSKLSKDDLVPVVKSFITDNKFITETDADKIGSVEVCDTRINEDSQNNPKGKDFIINQNVILRRTVNGKPVINSQLSIEVYPDSKEITGIDCFNWPSLEENRKTALSKEALKTANASGEEELSNHIYKRIAKSVRNIKNVDITDISEGWFQADDNLLPVAVVNYTAICQNDTEAHPYMEVINLAGNDDVFNKDYRKDYKPAELPEIDY